MQTDLDKILALIATLASGDPTTGATSQLAAGGHDPAYPVAIAPCPRPIGRYEIEGKTIVCGTVNVPEDHARPDGRRIDLVFTVLKSHSMYPEPDPLVHLHGGPGGALLAGLKGFAGLFDAWRATRDVVMFDQRAAGFSARSSDCYEAMSANVLDLVRKTDVGPDGVSKTFTACVAELKAAGIGLAHYNTQENAKDVVAITKALGYPTYNLYGISYGTKLSLEVMRQAPEGLRAVVIDGVAPPSVKLYDTLAVPQDEAMVRLVEECKADEACNAAYPDLKAKIDEAFATAAAGKAILEGTPLPASIVSLMFQARNGAFFTASHTGYLPAAIYEIAAGGTDMPTVKLIIDKELKLPRQTSADISAGAGTLTDGEKRLLDLALANAGLASDASRALDLSVDELKDALRRSRELGPLPDIFDEEMVRASAPLTADPARAAAALKDYASLQNAKPSKDLLRRFVATHFDGSAQERLLALISAMSEAELGFAFDSIRDAVGHSESDFAGNAHLFIYACQEDLPYNSLAGFEELSKTLTFPQIAQDWRPAAEAFYKSCELLAPVDHPGFHDPVKSAVPTLSLGSTWDIQTAQSWAGLAVETLDNAQAFIIPEAGHGAIVYQQCAIDMGVAFINDPSRKLDNRCAESARPAFHIAPWVKK